jgi:arsenate reductase
MRGVYNVLFLCTGNSARSIMAEAIMNQKGRPRFTAYSAGSHPKGEVHPAALRQLESARLPTEGYRSKNWDEFAQPGAPRLDFVFTVCDNAAAEVCPVWPGQPMTAHWGVPDPAAVEGIEEQIQRAFTGHSSCWIAASACSYACPWEVSIALQSNRRSTRSGNNEPQAE